MAVSVVSDVFDEWTRPDSPRLSAVQADAAVNVVRLAETLAGGDLDQFGEELIRNSRARLGADPVGVFLMDVALRLASERQRGSSRPW